MHPLGPQHGLGDPGAFLDAQIGPVICVAPQSAQEQCHGMSATGATPRACVRGVRPCKLLCISIAQCGGPALLTNHFGAMPGMSVMGAAPRACMSRECDTANWQAIRILNAVAQSCTPLTSEQCHGMSAMGATPRACMSRECDYANFPESELPMQWPCVAQQSPPSNALACQRCVRLRGPAYLQLPRGEARTTSPAP